MTPRQRSKLLSLYCRHEPAIWGAAFGTIAAILVLLVTYFGGGR
ncbi:MAG: hypothetical protein RLZZ157_85 [Pseudomonadota bacterium]|jgi:hypothetical protein